MKLKYELEIMNIDGSPMAVPVDGNDNFCGILQMNETATDIIEILKEDVSEDEIVSALKSMYDATEEDIRHNVQKVIAVLKENGLITE